jgi:GT2 family glycosyltransferase
MNTNICDIIISTYGRGGDIDAAISSIRANKHSAFTLWVLDQNKDDHTASIVARHASEDTRICYLRVPLRGIAPTRNHGARLGHAPYILFTNDDCHTDPEWAAALTQELSREQTPLVFGRVLPGPGASLSAGQVLATKLAQQREIYEHDRFNLSFGHGHNMGVRREWFTKLGCFDELLGQSGPLGSWDDRDLGYRLLRRGGRIVYSPEAVVEHRHWQIWEQIGQRYRDYGIGTGAAVAKYVRCGDPAAMMLLFEWMLSQGARQMISGAVKWRNQSKVKIGMLQFFYPWLGLRRGFQHHCRRDQILYIP